MFGPTARFQDLVEDLDLPAHGIPLQLFHRFVAAVYGQVGDQLPVDEAAARRFLRLTSIQDRDGGGPLLCASRGSFPLIEKVFADSGYAGEKVATTTVIAVEIVRKSPDQVGFAVQPRRWVVERFFAWINRNRRLAKDFEATIASARAFLYAASVMLLVRRLARAA